MGFLFRISFLYLFFNNGFGQIINIENKRIHENKLGWAGNVNLAFNFVQNQNRLFSYNITPHAQWKDSIQAILAYGVSEYSRGSNATFQNAHVIHLRYWRKWNKLCKWEMYNQFQFNELLKLRLRYLAGTGMRFKFQDSKKLKLYFGSGYMYELERLQNEYSDDHNNRWANYFSWHNEPNEALTISGSFYYQPRFDRFRDYRLSSQVLIVNQLRKRLDIRFIFNQLYDNEPPEGVRKHNFNSSLGFGWKLGKLG